MQNLAQTVQSRFPNLIISASNWRGDETVIVKKEGIKDFLASLKNTPGFEFNVLMDLSCVDYLYWEEKECRFEVVYNLFSISQNHRLFVKAQVLETDPVIDSVVSVWPAADWLEREVWDMFGIRFSGHPNLKRILMYEEFKGHPLRKDYPYNQRQPLIGPMN